MYAYLDRLSPWSVQRLRCIQNSRYWFSVEDADTVSTFSNRALAHTLYHLPSKHFLRYALYCVSIVFRPSPVACIPNARSFCGGDGGLAMVRC